MVIYFSGTGNSKYIADRIATAACKEKLLCMNEPGSNRAMPGLLRQERI